MRAGGRVSTYLRAASPFARVPGPPSRNFRTAVAVSPGLRRSLASVSGDRRASTAGPTGRGDGGFCSSGVVRDTPPLHQGDYTDSRTRRGGGGGQVELSHRCSKRRFRICSSKIDRFQAHPIWLNLWFLNCGSSTPRLFLVYS